MESSKETCQNIQNIQNIQNGPATTTALCLKCQKVFNEPLDSYKAPCQNTYFRFQVAHVRDYFGQQSCPGCRLFAAPVNHVRSMQTGDASAFGACVVVADLRVREEFIPCFNKETGRHFLNFSAAGRVIDVHLTDGSSPQLRTLAGTIIKIKTSGETIRLNDDGSGDKVRGLLVPPLASKERMKQWLAKCRDSHPECRGIGNKTQAGNASTSESIRLIDVQGRCIVSGTLANEFVALSYVWGATTKPLMLRNVLAAYSATGGLDCAPLPQTISDAMELTRDLGLRYLWVDSLCIVQDDDSDKQQQLPLMVQLYERAQLVVVATSGADANGGLAGLNAPRNSCQTSETINGNEYIANQGDIADVLQWTRWDSRGWTYQEGLRSRRALVFTEQLVYWSCQAHTWREDMDMDYNECSVDGVRLRLTERNSLLRFLPARRPLVCLNSLYCTSAERFSQRALKEGSDAFWAFAGVLDFLNQQFPVQSRPGARYLWAHPWSSNLHASLLWKQKHTCLASHARIEQHTVAVGANDTRLSMPFPSWSWLSTTAGIKFMDPCGGTTVGEVELHAPLKLCGRGTDHYLSYLEMLKAAGAKEALEEFKSVGFPKKAPKTVGQRSESLSDLGLVSDFGLLCFTAQTVQLPLRHHTDQLQYGPGSACNLVPGGTEMGIYADVFSPMGDCLGEVTDLLRLYGKEGKTERTGDFILMSSNAAKDQSDDLCQKPARNIGCSSIQHQPGCGHIQSHNLMLVEWQEGVAYRRGMVTISKAHWETLPPESKAKKLIILG